MCAAAFARLIGIERRVNAAIHDIRTSSAGCGSDLVPPECVACVDADADHVARLDRARVELLERFVDELRLSVERRRR
jgi:predicted RNA methylase